MAASTLPETYKAAVVETAGGPLVLKDLPMKHPGPGQLLVKVLACGVCGTDKLEQQGALPHRDPIVMGHEFVGDVVSLGPGVVTGRFAPGDRVGGAWHGGHDGVCRACQRGAFQMCDGAVVNGVSVDGGYAGYALLRAEAAVPLPRDADPAATAPLLCAGVTVFNGIRKMRVEQGNLVAVQGLGGLGHLAVQYARAMGYRVVAISSGAAKERFAAGLGAHGYIDSSARDPAEVLSGMGGAALIVATAPSPTAIGNLVGGLQAQGKLLVLPIVGPIAVDSAALVLKGGAVVGWPCGHALDCAEAVEFAETHGVKCLIEKFPLHEAQRAFDQMASGEVRFRAVLTME
ncbi:uncharacterized protein E0L32_011898 [Thyridium curvatum]|uniref:Enoyl reductase (ER) domain-containing protein n=1 Tax=Thyridium curvatum TaxID=1093900 RepID=A0A507B6V8_9PEZI|nr:uncharacterized protein E0L32_011898 [Thyridium curvatum]TPX18032.1 hypothetical protein E0L32_011898 [Thyridium curvatum]